MPASAATRMHAYACTISARLRCGDAIDADTASRMTNYLLAASKNHPQEDLPLRIDTVYDEQRGRLRIIITGSFAATSYLLLLVSLRLEQP